MKRLFTLLLVLVLSMSLVACGGADTGEDVAGEGTQTIGFVISTQTNPFFVSLKQGAEEKAKEKAKELGVEIIVLDSQDDPAKEMANMEDLITKKVDLILVNPTDSDAVVNSVKAANDAEIPVIMVDRASDGGEVLSFFRREYSHPLRWELNGLSLMIS